MGRVRDERRPNPTKGTRPPTHNGSDELERGTGGLEIDWEGFGGGEKRENGGLGIIGSR